MTRFVGTPLRGIEFSTVSDETFSVRVNGDNYARVRIDAGGRLNWSSGSATFDTNLFRDSANMLQTDDAFKAALGIVTLTTAGAPEAVLPDGAIAIDNTNNRLYFRSNSNWLAAQGGATVSSEAPGSPIEGSLWFDIDDDTLYVREGNSWVTTGGSSVTVSDAAPTAGLAEGDLWFESDTGRTFVRYDSFWVEIGGIG
jgi:hypothetical protein